MWYSRPFGLYLWGPLFLPLLSGIFSFCHTELLAIPQTAHALSGLCALCVPFPMPGMPVLSLSGDTSVEKSLSFLFSFLNSYQSNVETLRSITVVSPCIMFVHVFCFPYGKFPWLFSDPSCGQFYFHNLILNCQQLSLVLFFTVSCTYFMFLASWMM